MIAQVPWWMTVTWALALIGVGVAILAFRRSRLPSLRVHRIRSDCIGRHPGYEMHDYLRVEFVCRGSDVFDLRLVLACDHSYWSRGKRQSLIREHPFKVVGDLPNPLKAGQLARFELGDHHWRDLRKWYDPRLPSELKPWKVKLIAYQSGKRKIFSRSSWRFRSALRAFDNHPVQR